MLATKIDQGSVLMPLGNARIDGSRPICWESRAFAERVPSTFADRAERAGDAVERLERHAEALGQRAQIGFFV